MVAFYRRWRIIVRQSSGVSATVRLSEGRGRRYGSGAGRESIAEGRVDVVGVSGH